MTILLLMSSAFYQKENMLEWWKVVFLPSTKITGFFSGGEPPLIVRTTKSRNMFPLHLLLSNQPTQTFITCMPSMLSTMHYLPHSVIQMESLLPVSRRQTMPTGLWTVCLHHYFTEVALHALPSHGLAPGHFGSDEFHLLLY